jgi:hypothetical protein
MSAELLASKVVVQEEEPQIRTISGVPTATAACVGITEKGPIGEATLCTSFAQWRGIFGGDIADGYACQAVRGFFENGGQVLYFTRTVHYTDVGTPATKTSVAASLNLATAVASASAGTVLGTATEPFALTPGDTLDLSVDGGATDSATIDAARASVTAGNSATYALVDGYTLLVKIDGGAEQTITFLTAEFVSIGAATAAEVNAVINAKLSGGYADLDTAKPRINSDTQGTDSAVQVTGGTANAILGFSTSAVAGTGDVGDIDAVTVAELKTVIEADVADVVVNNVGGAVQIVADGNAPGVTSSIQVEATSTADDELGLDNAVHSGSSGAAVDTLTVNGKYDGTYGNNLTILISAATSGEAARFNLVVLSGGVVVERFPNMTMDPDDDNYVETIINDTNNGSKYISVVDLDVDPTDASAARPANSPGATPVAYGPLTGGDDGLTSIADTDFIGDETGKTGIRSFDTVLDLRLLFIPDRPTSAVHNAMITYCEITRDMSMFAILDPPAGLGASEIITYVDTTAGLLNLSEFAAIYWPQVKVINPSSTIFGNVSSVTVPPSGHIAGCYARTDGARVGGVYDPPSNEKGRLSGVIGLETDEVIEEARRDLVFPKRINPITKLSGQPIAIDGARTLKGGGNFPSISERRGVIFIEQSIKNGLEFARNKNNDAELRAAVARTITAFLIVQMKVGAFRTKNPATAFFVDVSEALNPASEVFAGKLNARIGLATQKPAEYIVLTFSQDTRALEEELAASTS